MKIKWIILFFIIWFLFFRNQDLGYYAISINGIITSTNIPDAKGKPIINLTIRGSYWAITDVDGTITSTNVPGAQNLLRRNVYFDGSYWAIYDDDRYITSTNVPGAQNLLRRNVQFAGSYWAIVDDIDTITSTNVPGGQDQGQDFYFGGSYWAIYEDLTSITSTNIPEIQGVSVIENILLFDGSYYMVWGKNDLIIKFTNVPGAKGKSMDNVRFAGSYWVITDIDGTITSTNLRGAQDLKWRDIKI